MGIKKIPDRFLELFCEDGVGIEAFITNSAPDLVIETVNSIDDEKEISFVKFNQLLVYSKIPAVSQDFFKFYWCRIPDKHIYNIFKLPCFKVTTLNFDDLVIKTQDQLFFGFYRLFVDMLYVFGNINKGFEMTRFYNENQLRTLFNNRMYNTESISKRGEPLNFKRIEAEKKYLISENVYKNFGEDISQESKLEKHLVERYQMTSSNGISKFKIKNLLQGKHAPDKSIQLQLNLSAEDLLEVEVNSVEEIRKKVKEIAKQYLDARTAAKYNTEMYLSLVNELDVYVATSMRKKQDFMDVDSLIQTIFKSDKLENLHLRYFDPTMSAADGHEDKGIIECLMVKSAKILIYNAGENDSYGKDAEAAMALSLGKPVIFYCKTEAQKNQFKNIHPLSRLIDFNTGVVVGALICHDVETIIELVDRTFNNTMEYELKKSKQGYYRLVEKETQSVVRIQTDDKLLSSSFWNYYHNNS